LESNQRCITQEDWRIMPAAKKQAKKQPSEVEKHIEFIYGELEELREKLEKVLVRMGL